uniref:Si:ch73-379j16.2 n=1 Tax=Salarias fasciatus TaxID=181472 RepID=A0A672FMV1_SALFA
ITNAACLLDLKIVVENPLEVHYVTVEITDANDHGPSFVEKEKKIEIAESTLPGARFQLPGAQDPDVGINSVQRYKLSQNENFHLEIRDRGEDKIPFLLLQRHLDREQKTNHSLILTAMDGGTPPKSAHLNLTIQVLDINDNRPVFSKEVYSVELQENAAVDTIIIQVKATDIDEGVNGDVEYAFGGDINPSLFQLFSLDNHTGQIRVKGQIDYEAASVYKLDVQASDKGQPPMTTDCRVIIKIEDINDNKPEIEVTSISNMVPEDSKHGTVIALISVKDTDSGLNGKVICHLTENVPFELKPSFKENMYSLVTKEALDREINQNSGALYVGNPIDREGLCQGSGACLTELKILVENPLEIHYVLVEITDVNDHSPSFPEKEQTFEIAEQTLPGKRFQLHTARDPDAGINSIRTYTLTANEHFEVNLRQSDTGKIPFLVLRKPLDREQKDKHTLLVTAVDGGKPQRSGTLNVSIIVLDSNDNRPIFSQEIYQISIKENIHVGTSVFRMNATDLDEDTNGKVEYSLGKTLRQKVYNMFEIDKLSGDIIIRGEVDYEENDQFELDVEASDRGTPPLTGECTLNVSIIVLDSNDNRPIFSQEMYQIEIQENVSIGTSLFKINATDPDEGTNGEIEYSLVKTLRKNIYRLFELDKLTGLIKVKGLVDYEENDVYKLDVEASDKATPPMTGESRVIIKVIDVNDNPPEIEVTSLSNTVSEDSKVGTVISLLSVTDKDSGVNGKIITSIISDGPFELKPSYKENIYSVVTKGLLDREQVSHYELTIKATDCGEPPLFTFKTFSIQITDVNDNKLCG